MAATTKSSSVSNPIANSTQTGNTKEEIYALKNKISELERQVNEYKTKVDGLRRAKATTVIKLEKEYVNATDPGTSRTEKSKPCEKCDEYERMIENEKKTNVELKKIVEQKDKNNKTNKQQQQQLQTNNNGPCSKCEDYKQLTEIEKQNNIDLYQQADDQKKQTEQERHARETAKKSLELFQTDLIKTKQNVDKLQKQNQEYKDGFLSMKKEYENKMADLVRREEEAKKQVSTWEQMYREWMSNMERRVSSLQVTNQELQTWIHQEDENDQQFKSYPTRTQRR